VAALLKRAGAKEIEPRPIVTGGSPATATDTATTTVPEPSKPCEPFLDSLSWPAGFDVARMGARPAAAPTAAAKASRFPKRPGPRLLSPKRCCARRSRLPTRSGWKS
jgi:hypothetical protein